MATLADAGRINLPIVQQELERLRASWEVPAGDLEGDDGEVLKYFEVEPGLLDRIDLFDRAQLLSVLRVLRGSRSLSDAGRKLFAESRKQKSNSNDADRLRKYLARFGVSWRREAAGE
jgi:transcriptional regulatory protein RtcR